MSNSPHNPSLPKGKQTYTIVPKIQVGMVTRELLETITRVVKEYDIPTIKITAAQRLVLFGVKPEVVEEVRRELGPGAVPLSAPGVHYVAACSGVNNCRFGLLDSLSLGSKLEKALDGLELPAKAKFAVSACPRNCSQGYVRDVGVFANASGWTLTFGGNGGGRPRFGDVIAEKLTDQQVLELAQKCLGYYRDKAKKNERTARFIERIGIEEFKQAVL